MTLTALQSSKKPWVHLVVLPEKSKVDLHHLVLPHSVIRTMAGAKCRTKAGLLDEFARALSFPEYFGHNWDALEECLADLDWLPAQGYLLVVTDADQVLAKPEEEDDYETFIEILTEAGEAWSTRELPDMARAGIPFHTLLTVSVSHKHKRKNWLVPPLAIEKGAGDSKRSGSSKVRAR
jgi:hypothetical protein